MDQRITDSYDSEAVDEVRYYNCDCFYTVRIDADLPDHQHLGQNITITGYVLTEDITQFIVRSRPSLL